MKTTINRGSALVLVMIALVILSLIGLAALTQTGSEINTAGNFYKDKSAFYAADAGIEFGLDQIKINSTNPALVIFGRTIGESYINRFNYWTGRLTDSMPQNVKGFPGIHAVPPVGQSIEMGSDMNMIYGSWELVVSAENQAGTITDKRVRKQLQTVVCTMMPAY